MCLSLSACFLASIFVTPSAAKNDKYASLVMDADTGVIISERYADKTLHPASLTKIMTLLMLFDSIEQGKMNLNSRIPISRHAASMVPSKLGLKPGSSIKAQDAIYALVTKSANDIAAAIAESIGGTESNFALMMTRKAHAIGMRSTTFRNASGLHDPRQVTTARDMALLAQYVINAYPRYYRYFSTASFTYQGHTYRNHNRLMASYKGMDGMKTGYINASGFNLVASAVRNNRRLIGVVFGGRSSHTRNAHMAEILDRAFGEVDDIRIASVNVPLPGRKPEVPITLASLEVSGGGASGNPSLDAVVDSLASHIPVGSMGRFIGEGDYDYERVNRIKTGMIAIAAHTGRQYDFQPRRLKPLNAGNDGWAIQLGALSSRAATDKLLINSMSKLPNHYAGANRVIAPLKTKNGWLYRGRLAGFTRTQAVEACSYFRDCMPIAPRNY